MSASENVKLVELVEVGLTEALAANGFVASDPLNPDWGVWFTDSKGGLQGATAAVALGFEKHRYGGIGVAGYVAIQSEAANEVLVSMPPAAWLRNESEESLRFGFVDLEEFPRLSDPRSSILARHVSDQEGVGGVVEWFVRIVSNQRPSG
ncbi:hypothetical protein [Nocardia acidivorans]|uniref:hypothetical protein n=1 Tax=Nocardia acidivorans TaxID=404580 RepID=UPI0008371D5D|nr:hypothetical protein [Nocardia acidivorans]